MTVSAPLARDRRAEDAEWAARVDHAGLPVLRSGAGTHQSSLRGDVAWSTMRRLVQSTDRVCTGWRLDVAGGPGPGGI